MKGFTINKRIYYYLTAASLILIWAVLARLVGNPVIIPSPGETLERMVEIVKDERFSLHIYHTLRRSIQSFALTLFFALLLGILSSMVKVVNLYMVPILALLRSVPTMAIIILTLIWLSSDHAPILIGMIVVFPIVYESVYRGMLNVDNRLIQMANLYSVNHIDIIRDIYLPTIYVYLGSVIGASLGLTLKSVIAGEVLGQPRFSIGASLQLEKLFLNTAGVFAWIAIVVFLVAALEMVFRALFAKTEHWK